MSYYIKRVTTFFTYIKVVYYDNWANLLGQSDLTEDELSGIRIIVYGAFYAILHGHEVLANFNVCQGSSSPFCIVIV